MNAVARMRATAFPRYARPTPVALLLASSLACGPRPVPSPPVGSEFIEVDYPPPPAQIEEIQRALPGRADCSWLDGHYRWQGRRWEWLPGAWVVMPAGCARAPGTLSYSKGPEPRLYYTPPYWYATGTSNTPQAAPCAPVVPCQSPLPKNP